MAMLSRSLQQDPEEHMSCEASIKIGAAWGHAGAYARWNHHPGLHAGAVHHLPARGELSLLQCAVLDWPRGHCAVYPRSGQHPRNRIEGNIDVSSKESDIEVEQNGRGDVKAVSGTGNLELRNLHGALRAVTDAGSIKVSGVPAGDWSVQTGRGDIELTLGNAACTIDAQTGAGLVRSDLRIEGANGSDPHRLAGRINGGGHSVSLQAGEGEIRIR
jgi:hypothetical protein